MIMRLDTQTYKLSDIGVTRKVLQITGVVAFVLTLLGLFVNSDQFFHSYLTAYVFWLTVSLGGLFFTMMHHLTGAVWSVVLRRITEIIMMTIPVMAILFIPVIFGIHNLYHWSHGEAVAADELLAHKSPYLNTTFFIIRAAVYFTIWILLARGLYNVSLRQDSGYDDRQVKKMRWISALGMVLFAVSVTFAAFDWLMSLDAHWYSTIFGVYVFSGALVAIISVLIILMALFRRLGILDAEVTYEHYHDLGKLLFAFMVFWAYMAFSQYFLIWYGNIPEETIWFMHRWEGSWKAVTMLLVLGHFAIPFFILIVRGTKRNLKALTFMAAWLLALHWVDLYWIIFPSLHHHGAQISWMDLTAFIGIGGLFLSIFIRQLSRHPVVPVNDPNLEKSVKFINA
ncbi:MAG: hypothetical protein GF315_06230 [candidate division Zixibacteria bacterium]|nr:hypothetical protein [candidate division Zixibacteria bacterium]